MTFGILSLNKPTFAAETGGAGGAAPAAAPAAVVPPAGAPPASVPPADTPPASAPPASTPPKVGEKPADLPDAFWDPATGLKSADAAKALKELSAFKSEHDTRMGLRPATADEYKLELPTDFKMPAGVTFKFDDKSPLVAAAREFAHNAGIDQNGFSQLVASYVQENLQRAEQAGAQLGAERAKLGEKGPERVAAVENGLRSILTAEQYAGIRGVVTNAHAVAAVETLLAKINGSGIPVADGSAAPAGSAPRQPTQDDFLAAMYPTMRKKG